MINQKPQIKPPVGIEQIPPSHLNTAMIFMGALCVGAMACIGGLF